RVVHRLDHVVGKGLQLAVEFGDRLCRRLQHGIAEGADGQDQGRGSGWLVRSVSSHVRLALDAGHVFPRGELADRPAELRYPPRIEREQAYRLIPQRRDEQGRWLEPVQLGLEPRRARHPEDRGPYWEARLRPAPRLVAVEAARVP